MIILFKSCFLFLTLVLFLDTSTKINSGTSLPGNTNQYKSGWMKATGNVSDMYVAHGCGFVIISIRKKEKDTLILIPKSPIIGFEKNNLAIKFSYRILKTHSKKGCGPGIPVQIMALEKK
jgi:hypothetical protein